MTELGTFFGRFHPVIVHLPIGILLVAAALDVLARTRRFAVVRPAVGPLLVAGAASAVLAAGTGWLLGEGVGYAGDTYTWHLRLGIGVAIGAVLTAIVYGYSAGPDRLRQGSGRPREPLRAQAEGPALHTKVLHTKARLAYPAVMGVTVLLVAIAGHLGDTLTHGEGYLTEHLPGWLRFGNAADQAPRVASRTLVFDEIVQPVLQARCAACHGADRPQGGLRLDTRDGLLKGGDAGPVVVAGRPDGSELIRRIWLPPSHKDAMPPRGSRPLTVAEAAVLRWWVEEGASFEATLADVEVASDVLPALEARLGPLDLGAPAILAVPVPPADPRTVEGLRAGGIGIAPLADGTPFLSVDTTNVAPRFDDRQLASLVALAPQVTWLSLSGTGITDEGLATLARFSNLTRLHLDGTRITDAGLAHLAALERLEYLNLYGTAVTDAGLQHLSGLHTLRTLYLWKTQTTTGGVGQLRAALPRLRVDRGVALGQDVSSENAAKPSL